MSKVQYPGLEIPASAQGEQRVFLEGVKEIVESITGTDGGNNRMLSVQELIDLGIVKAVGSGSRQRLIYTPPDVDIPDIEQPKYARLTANTQFFTFASGTPAPTDQTITFTVIRGVGTEGEATWTTYPDVDLGAGGDQVTLSVADFASNDSVRVRVELDGVFDEMTVFRLEQSDSGVGCFLTNESHVISADVTGAVANFDGANGLFKVFDGATDVSGSATFSVVSQVNCAGTINTATDTPVNGQPRGYYQIVSMSDDTAQLVVRATYNGATFDKTFSVSKSRQGAGGESSAIIRLVTSSQQFYFDSFGNPSPPGQSITFQLVRNPAAIETAVWSSVPDVALVGAVDTRTLSIAAMAAHPQVKVRVDVGSLYDEITIVRTEQGDNGVVGFLTNEAHVAPADASGNIADYAPLSGRFNVFDGATNVTHLATFSVVSTLNCTGTINTADNTPVSGQLRGYYRVTALVADYGELRLRAVYNGEQIDKVFSITKSNRPLGSGANLVSNGSAQLGNNYNFKGLRGQTALTYHGNGGIEGSAYFSCTGTNGFITSDEAIPYRAGQVFEVAAALRSNDTADNKTYIGVQPFDAAGNPIVRAGSWRVAGASTTLQANVTAGQTTLRIVPPGADWVPHIAAMVIQFATAADDLDMPVPIARIWYSAGTVSINKANAPTYWEVTMNSPAPFSYTAGTRVSIADDGGTYPYCTLANSNPTASWTKHSGRIFGVNDKNSPPTSKQFHYGTTTFRPLILSANLAAAPRTLQIDDIWVSEVSTSALAGFLTNEAHIVPATSAGVVTSFDGADGLFKVFSGLTDVTDQCTFSLNTTNCTGTVNNMVNSPVSGQPRGYYRVTAMSADTAQMTLSAAYAGVTVQKIFTVTKSYAGAGGAAAKSLALSASAQTFKFNGSGIATPAVQTINFTCARQNIAAAASWSTVPSVTLTGTGDSRALTVANFGANTSVKVRVEAEGLFDEITVVRVQDGPQGTPGTPGDPGPPGQDGTPAFTLVGSSNVQIVINRVTKTGSAVQWDAGAYSAQSYPGGAFCTFRAGQTNANFMAGLNSDPTTDHSYLSLDYAWYVRDNGTLSIYESGEAVGNYGSYSTSTVLSVTYDGHAIRYIKGGVTQRTVRKSGLTLHFDSSIYTPLGVIADIGFGPAGARGAPGGNLLDNEVWTAGPVVTAAGNFTSAQTASGESTLVLSGTGSAPLGPYGTTDLLWEAKCLDPAFGSGGEANGGWYNEGDLIGLDPSKSYRSIVWVRRNAVSSPNSFYHGCSGNHTNNLDGAENTNPYFHAMGLDSLIADKWYLSVGLIHGTEYAGAPSGLSGLWDPSTGTRSHSGIDYKMKPGTDRQRHRTFMYYGGNTSVRLWLCRPRFEEVNGNEPSITTLLSPQGALAYRNSVGTDQINPNAASAVTFAEVPNWVFGSLWTNIVTAVVDHRKNGQIYTQPSVHVRLTTTFAAEYVFGFQNYAAIRLRLRIFDLVANQYILPDPQKYWPNNLMSLGSDATSATTNAWVRPLAADFVVPGSAVDNKWVRYEISVISTGGAYVPSGTGFEGVMTVMENKR